MPKFNLPVNYLIAIVFVRTGTTPQFEPIYDCKKYRHNLKDTTHYITKFCRDMKHKFPSTEYINFYYKDTGAFKERIYT